MSNLETIENLKSLQDKLKVLNKNKDLATFVELFQINKGIQALLEREEAGTDFRATNELLQKLVDKEEEQVQITLTLE